MICIAGDTINPPDSFVKLIRRGVHGRRGNRYAISSRHRDTRVSVYVYMYMRTQLFSHRRHCVYTCGASLYDDVTKVAVERLPRTKADELKRIDLKSVLQNHK